MKRTTNDYISIVMAASFGLCGGACNVEDNSPEPQGVKLDDGEDQDEATDDSAGDAGAATDGGSGESTRTRGFYVVHSDFDNSSSVSVVDVDGEVLSETLLASGQEPAGLSFDVGSDLALPTTTLDGDEVVVLDRTNNVIDWVDLERAEVTRQLNVGPGGFLANPYDYVPYRSDKAFVTRHNTNLDPGQAEFDEGGDLLIIDPSEPEIRGRIDLAETTGDERLWPRPDSALFTGGALYVMVVAIDADFYTYGESRLVTVDPERDEVIDVLPVDDMVNCGGLALSPGGERLAVGCNGDWADPLGGSGITIVDISGEAPVIEAQYFAEELGDVQLSTLSFASADVLLFTTYGNSETGRGDSLQRLELRSGRVDEEALLETDEAFSLWSLRCAPDQEVCMLADSATAGGTLHRLQLDAGEVESIEPVEYEAGIGMPPRTIGAF